MERFLALEIASDARRGPLGVMSVVFGQFAECLLTL